MTKKIGKKKTTEWHIPLSPGHKELIEKYQQTFGVDFVTAWYHTQVESVVGHVPTRHGDWNGPVPDPWEHP